MDNDLAFGPRGTADVTNFVDAKAQAGPSIDVLDRRDVEIMQCIDSLSQLQMRLSSWAAKVDQRTNSDIGSRETADLQNEMANAISDLQQALKRSWPKGLDY